MNIEQIRDDISDYHDKLFLNSAGSSLMSKSVVEQITTYLHDEVKYGGYLLAEKQSERIGEFYAQAAQLINSKAHNLAFTHDATDSYIKALSSIPFERNDVILTSDDDYASNHIQFISLQKRFGIKIRRIKTLDNGDLDILNFEELVERYRPKLVAITHVPTNSGLVQNVKAIGKICHEQGVLFLLDACQSIGQLNVNVQDLKCDFLTATGRKFLRGPRGTGFLFVSDRVLHDGYYPLFIDGFGATWQKTEQFEILPSAKRFETWEKSYALQIGLAEAIRYQNEIGIDNIQLYNLELMMRLRKNLSSVSGINLYDRGSNKCNILTFTKDNKSLESITTQLNSNHVIYSVSHKNWGIIDFDKKRVEWVIRISPHYFNTLAEMDKVSEIIDEI